MKQLSANCWFIRNSAGQYDYSRTLLLMPDVEWQRPQHDDGQPEEDTFDRFIRNGQCPVR